MKKTKIYLLSLGCAKNLVNSEQMLALLEAGGYKIVKAPADADVAIVNTCGFIDAAKSEAIESILEFAELKKTGSLRGLIVAGCLSQRYGSEFASELPEVDAVLGTGSYTDICAAVAAVCEGRRAEFFAPAEQSEMEGGRVLLTPRYSAYLRIAEGCDNRCAYCVIPYIRGPYRSRKLENIVAEASELARGGTKELLVVAQDITRYGTDIYGRRRLHELLSELCKIEGIEWIRLHYLYPDEIDDELLEVCAREPKILHYFDLPIQHISDSVLSAMNRRGDGAHIRNRIDRIRALMPDAVIRTSLIVGFPGETEQDFSELCQFLREYRLERAGVFCYSQEEGSPAASFEGQIDEQTKEERRAALYQIQEGVMDEKSAALVGKTLRVLCCGRDERGYIGRTYMDSPDIDGIVVFQSRACAEGSFINIRISGYDACDLFGSPAEEEAYDNRK